MEDKIEHITRHFRPIGTAQGVELSTFVQQYLSQNPDCEIYIGCDSQNFKTCTIYVTAVVFRFPGMGAKVLYRKEKLGRIEDMWTKLWGETERSVALASYLRDECGVAIKQIDLDYNEDPTYASHKLLSASSGYVKSMGFRCAFKPQLLMAVWIANSLCQ